MQPVKHRLNFEQDKQEVALSARSVELREVVGAVA